jgi:hypothetical protein
LPSGPRAGRSRRGATRCPIPNPRWRRSPVSR